jgi:membrane associated rhomboid family serine protease
MLKSEDPEAQEGGGQPARIRMIALWFPVNTDAPVYHFPWATLSLVGANFLIFAATVAGEVPVDQWMLTYGEIAPLQWITSNFVHAGFGHLLGNMFFLWSVGLIIEGKLGWKMFSLVYLGIGVTQCAIEQVCMLGAEGGSLGASSIVFGLTAMALVWAPKNEISFWYVVWVFFFIRAGVVDVTVLTYSVFVTFSELLVFTLQGFQIGTAALHLMGGVLGYWVAVVMLKRGLVDCEGWDLFSVLKGTNGRVEVDPSRTSLGWFGTRTHRRRRRRSKAPRMLSESAEREALLAPAENPQLTRTDRLRQRLLQHLDDQKPLAAWQTLQKLQHTQPTFRLDREPLRKLALGMIEHEQWNDAVLLLEEYLERFEEQAAAVRLQLALVLLYKQRRPRAAQRNLEQIDPAELSASLQQKQQNAQQAAARMIDSGVIELSGQAFGST